MVPEIGANNSTEGIRDMPPFDPLASVPRTVSHISPPYVANLSNDKPNRPQEGHVTIRDVKMTIGDLEGLLGAVLSLSLSL